MANKFVKNEGTHIKRWCQYAYGDTVNALAEYFRPPVKCAYLIVFFIISQPKHNMVWVLLNIQNIVKIAG